jgi:hypothetical protein
MTFSLLGQTLTLPTGTTRHTHNAYFLRLLGLGAIDVIRVDRAVSREEMSRAASGLLRHVESGSAVPNPTSIYVFTTHDAIRDEIDLDHTHAFSIVGFHDRHLRHYYYEKQHSRRFRNVTALSHAIDGPLESDTLRLLHFANTPDYRLPAKSSIFIVTGGEAGDVFFDTAPDSSLQRELLLDPNRSKGAVTLGVNEPDIYVALLGDDPSDEFTCGHNDACDLGPDKCVYDPLYPVNYCSHLPAPPTCLAVALAGMRRRRQVAFTTPVKFALLRSFRDEFLSRTTFGREYIGFYYVLSQHARLDLGTVRHYVSGLPHLYDAIVHLMAEGDADRIIVTTQLRDTMRTVLERHSQTEDPVVRKIVRRIESDLATLHGKTKAEFLAEIGFPDDF